ncbi:MAG: 30S ribosomal protein S9 [Planctomycetes bacterium]|nr:30S ribosomal protein S9 [Planctomycetota bacterium]
MDTEKPEEQSAETAANAEEPNRVPEQSESEAVGGESEGAAAPSEIAPSSPAEGEPTEQTASLEVENTAEETAEADKQVASEEAASEAVGSDPTPAESTPADEPAAAAEQTSSEAASSEQPVSEEAAEAPTSEEAAEATGAESAAGEAGAAVSELTLGSGPPAETVETEVPEQAVKPLIRGKVDKHGVAIGTGRRKTSVARVRIRDGNGLLVINGRRLEEYFRLEGHREQVEAPLKATGYYGKVDVLVRVNGGGVTGQAGAIALGIARALEAKEPGLHGVLSDGGYLTRDGRMVERKKYGLKKARKAPQFSKR